MLRKRRLQDENKGLKPNKTLIIQGFLARQAVVFIISLCRAKIGVEDTLREEIEEKKIPLQATLKRGLKNMPNEWLLNMCYHFGLDECQQRRDREKKIVTCLMKEQALVLIMEELEQDEKALLRYLLQQDGWARLRASLLYSRILASGLYCFQPYRQNKPLLPAADIFEQ